MRFALHAGLTAGLSALWLAGGDGGGTGAGSPAPETRDKSHEAMTCRLRVLVVEDSFMTARLLVRMIEDAGAEVVGPAPSVSRALALLDERECDAAILDINLGNETVEPVAQRLDDLGRPFFFVSGYASPKLIDPRFKARRLLAKPVDPATLQRAMNEAFYGDAPGARSHG